MDLSAELLRLKGFPLEFSGVSGSLTMKPERVELTSLRGKDRWRNLCGPGWIALNNFKLGAVAVGIERESGALRCNQQAVGHRHRILRLSGDFSGMLRLGGNLKMERGAFDEHLALVSISSGIFRSRRAQSIHTTTFGGRCWRFDLRLMFPQEFQVNYNLDVAGFKSEMHGDLRVTGTKRAPWPARGVGVARGRGQLSEQRTSRSAPRGCALRTNMKYSRFWISWRAGKRPSIGGSEASPNTKLSLRLTGERGRCAYCLAQQSIP